MIDHAQIANAFDEKLAKIYISVTVECLIVSAVCAGMIIFYLGFTTFAVLQSIGCILWMLLIFTLVLKIRKSHVKRDIEAHYTDASDLAEFENYLKAHSLEHEFLYAVMIKHEPADK